MTEQIPMYGIRSAVSKKWCFGICEPSKNKANKALVSKIGKDSYKWRFEIRKIPTNLLLDGKWVKCPPQTQVIPKEQKKSKYNQNLQNYNGIPLRLIERNGYATQKAKRFTINNTNQNVWIPNKHLEEDGTIKPNENLEYIFKNATRQLELAGIVKV